MSDSEEIQVLRGNELLPWIDSLGKLRIQVFREFPYLYEGSLDYEREYLAVLAESTGSLVAIVKDSSGKPVGATTCLPLEDESEEFRAPFQQAGIDSEKVLYLGESILLPEWRGKGLGKRFFEIREQHAQELGRKMTAFCAVDRSPNDPRRSTGFRALDSFWLSRGYEKRSDLQARFFWKEIGATEETEHTLTFWTREWTH